MLHSSSSGSIWTNAPKWRGSGHHKNNNNRQRIQEPKVELLEEPRERERDIESYTERKELKRLKWYYGIGGVVEEGTRINIAGYIHCTAPNENVVVKDVFYF